MQSPRSYRRPALPVVSPEPFVREKGCCHDTFRTRFSGDEHLTEPPRLRLERHWRNVGRGSHSVPSAAANRCPHRLIAVVSRLTQVASSTSLPSVPYSMSNPPGVAT